ncbi:MAG: VOC family protein [Desulfobaccales bacterium]
MIKFIDHIGLVVQDIESSLKLFTEALGLKLSEVENNDRFKVRIAFLPVGDTLVELIQPTAEGTMMANILKDRGESIHHIAFRVDDLEAELANLKAKGVALIHQTPQSGGLGARIAFLDPSAGNGVSIELVEKKQT